MQTTRPNASKPVVKPATPVVPTKPVSHPAPRRPKARGFTLVEILIVVIILGILAAIVIPQFTNASGDARRSSLVSQLQTLRSQVELYRLQHTDEFPPGVKTGGENTDWSHMTGKTDLDHVPNTAGQFGPYLQATPKNSLNGSSDVLIVTADVTPGATLSGGNGFGFVLNTTNGKLWATSAKFGFVFNEGNLSDANNQD